MAAVGRADRNSAHGGSEPPRRRARKPTPAPPDGLLTPAEAAARLRCSLKTLRAHVRSGALRYVITGHGKRRPAKAFASTDIAAFIEAQTRKDVPCPSAAIRVRHTGNTTSRSEVIDFSAHEGHDQAGSRSGRAQPSARSAKQQVAQAQAASTSLRLEDVAGRYWTRSGSITPAPTTHGGNSVADRVLRQGQALDRDHRRRRGEAGRVAARAPGQRAR